MKKKSEKLNLRKFKVASVNTTNSLLGGNGTGGDDSTIGRTSIGNTTTAPPPTVLSTDPNCN